MKWTLLRLTTGLSAAVFAFAMGAALPDFGIFVHLAIFVAVTCLTAGVSGFSAALLPAIAGSAFVFFILPIPVTLTRPLQAAVTLLTLAAAALVFRRREGQTIDPLSQATKIEEPVVRKVSAASAAVPPLEPLVDPATIRRKSVAPDPAKVVSPPPQPVTPEPSARKVEQEALKQKPPQQEVAEVGVPPSRPDTLEPVDRAAVDELLGRFTPARDQQVRPDTPSTPSPAPSSEEPWFQPSAPPPAAEPTTPPTAGVVEETAFNILPSTVERPLPAAPPPAPAIRHELPTVLLVEDESEMLALVSHTIRTLGYRLVVARDGEEGLRLARQEKPGLVLADALIPKLDGREMCRLIKEDPSLPPMKTVVMTGVYTYNKYKNEALARFKVDNYVFKPINLEELKAVLTKHLGSPSRGA